MKTRIVLSPASPGEGYESFRLEYFDEQRDDWRFIEHIYRDFHEAEMRAKAYSLKGSAEEIFRGVLVLAEFG